MSVEKSLTHIYISVLLGADSFGEGCDVRLFRLC